MQNPNEDIKLLWRSEYFMDAQCGTKGAGDTVSVSGFSDGTVLADYSPYTGQELNKEFANAQEAANWVGNFFSDDDLTCETDFDFLVDLDDL